MNPEVALRGAARGGRRGARHRPRDGRRGRAARSARCARPGHHATPGRPMGFCMFNNVAVGAAHALEAHGLQRVAVLDFDVHHGNGTEDAFHDDPRVMLCSTFQHPVLPLLRRRFGQRPHHQRAAAGDDRRRAASARRWSRSGCPALDRFQPAAGVRLGGLRRASRGPARLPATSRTRTTAGSPRSSSMWRAPCEGAGGLDARGRLQHGRVGALRGRASAGVGQRGVMRAGRPRNQWVVSVLLPPSSLGIQGGEQKDVVWEPVPFGHRAWKTAPKRKRYPALSSMCSPAGSTIATLGPATRFSRDFSPLTIVTSRLGTPNAVRMNSTSASLALPSTGGAARRILSASP